MAPNQATFALMVLFGTAALKVYGCVCYVGQERDRATKRYGWSLAEQRPCECTEFRLGGVNMNPQIKPHEVMIGEDNRVSINEQGKIVKSPDCNKTQKGTTFEVTPPCDPNTHRFGGTMELQLPMTSPMRLEFTVVNEAQVWVYFSPNAAGRDEALYKIRLYPDSVYTNKRESSSQSWGSGQSKRGANYTGVPVMITYDNGRFEVAVQGVQDSTQTYDVTSPPQPSWFVSFLTNDSPKVELSFTVPCINDFDPRF